MLTLMEAEHTNIQKWIRGSFKPKDMTKHLFISTLGIASLLFLSYRCYMQENPYSIFTNLISDLGNWQTNPRGWWIFSLAMVFSGLMTLPIISYVKRNLDFTKKTAITMGAWTLKANT